MTPDIISKRAELLAEKERVVFERDRLNQTILEIKEKVEAIDVVLAMFPDAGANGSNVSSQQRSLFSNDENEGQGPAWGTIPAGVIAVLKETQRRMTTREITQAMLDRGFPSNGPNFGISVATACSRQEARGTIKGDYIPDSPRKSCANAGFSVGEVDARPEI